MSTEPAGLMITGEAGIGKTTLWLDGCREARARGFQVLSARGDPSEVRLAFVALADLLRDVGDDVIELLPPVQRSALDRVLMRGDSGPARDEHAAAAAFQTVVQRLSETTPVLIAIDDVQWLDSSSAAAVRFAVRRLTGPLGVMATARTDDLAEADAAAWLRLQRPDAVERISVPPLTLGGLHALISERLGRPLPRPTMTRILDVSGGNPLYALELARAIVDGRVVDQRFPDSLAALVRDRVGGVDTESARLLLAASCSAEPTLQSVAAATNTPTRRVAELLETGPAARIVSLQGNSIRFAHPLLGTGVYADADPATRRELHRRLADYVEVPELRARHLAAAAVSPEPATLDALDAAAAVTRARGASAAAAELTELAIALGGDTPERRIRAAEQHFRAGAPARARQLLEPAIDGLPRGAIRCVALASLAAVLGYDDDVPASVRCLAQAADEVDDDTVLHLHCLLGLAMALFMTGQRARAVECAASGTALADRLGIDALRSRALSIWSIVSFAHGLGADHAALRTALELEDPDDDATTCYRASAAAAAVAAWTGDLHPARSQMQHYHQQMLSDGSELDVIWAATHLASIDVWLGRYATAAQASGEALERAEQMGARSTLVTAWAWHATVAAYLGNEADARATAGAAITAAHDVGAPYLAVAPTATLVFLEASRCDYVAAMEAAAPLLAAFDDDGSTEIITGGWLPDAIEALVALGRIDEALPLVDTLHTNGTRMDRAWMLAMAGRGRALCLAASGDLAAAEAAASTALTHRERLPMPFEHARTQLVLGQIQRRRRRRADAKATLTEALNVFETIGTPLWAARTRNELGRLNGVTGRANSGLTPAEQRVAERAAAGLSNKEIAAELFLSLKTVEMTLSSTYRKLGIRSRAQLFAHLHRESSAH